MSILITAMALAASPATAAVQPAPAPSPAVRAQSAQPGSKAPGDGCPCCKKMAEGGKMECCAKHGESHAGEHSKHASH